MQALCKPVHNYTCAGGGYNATTMQSPQDYWAWADYGGPKNVSYYGTDPHNCTLYAAYRLEQNGVLDPHWTANATDWATFAQNPP